MNVKGALTRKLGPLPAWAWLGIFTGAVLVYRRYKGQSAATASSSAAPLQPLNQPDRQSPVVLSSGESVYDPETGKLLTPGGGGEPQGPGSVPPGLEGGPIGTGEREPGYPLPPKRPRLKAKRLRGSPFGKRLKLRGRKVKPIGQGARAGHPAHRAVVRQAHAAAGRTRRGTVKVAALEQPAAKRARPRVPLAHTPLRARPEPTHKVNHATQKVVQKPKPTKRKVRHR